MRCLVLGLNTTAGGKSGWGTDNRRLVMWFLSDETGMRFQGFIIWYLLPLHVFEMSIIFKNSRTLEAGRNLKDNCISQARTLRSRPLPALICGPSCFCESTGITGRIVRIRGPNASLFLPTLFKMWPPFTCLGWFISNYAVCAQRSSLRPEKQVADTERVTLGLFITHARQSRVT